MPNPSNVSKVSVALTREMADLVQQAVDSGEYATGSEVIREALREWKLRRKLPLLEQEELRRLWAEGLASGPGRFEGIEAIKREGRRQLQARSSRSRS
jgi:antitoxin ParD1/3/4